MAVSETNHPYIDRIIEHYPEASAALAWLKRHGTRTDTLTGAILAKLHSRGRFLKPEQKLTYVMRSLLGEFFVAWAKKYKNKTFASIQMSPDLGDEIRASTMALCLIANEKAFQRNIVKLANRKVLEKSGSNLGNSDDYSCHVVSYSAVLLHRFLENFDPTRPQAGIKALRYLEFMSVSHYLFAGTKVMKDQSGLSFYLMNSSRLKSRTRIACKLAYLPNLLTKYERFVLRHKFRLSGFPVKRMKIKDIGKLLGYPNPAVISRKFYRMKLWAKAWEKQARELKND